MTTPEEAALKAALEATRTASRQELGDFFADPTNGTPGQSSMEDFTQWAEDTYGPVPDTIPLTVEVAALFEPDKRPHTGRTFLTADQIRYILRLSHDEYIGRVNSRYRTEWERVRDSVMGRAALMWDQVHKRLKKELDEHLNELLPLDLPPEEIYQISIPPHPITMHDVKEQGRRRAYEDRKLVNQMRPLTELELKTISKRCTSCQTTKRLIEFYARCDSRDGRGNRCKECVKIARKK